MYLLIRLGDTDTLKTYLNCHPNKTTWFLIISSLCFFKNLPRLFQFGLRKLLNPFAALLRN
jgi:hypothetical protein